MHKQIFTLQHRKGVTIRMKYSFVVQVFKNRTFRCCHIPWSIDILSNKHLLYEEIEK